MTHTTHPQKEDVRSYLAQRRESREPPPAPDRIREQLGWTLIEEEREQTNRTKR